MNRNPRRVRQARKRRADRSPERHANRRLFELGRFQRTSKAPFGHGVRAHAGRVAQTGRRAPYRENRVRRGLKRGGRVRPRRQPHGVFVRRFRKACRGARRPRQRDPHRVRPARTRDEGRIRRQRRENGFRLQDVRPRRKARGNPGVRRRRRPRHGILVRRPRQRDREDRRRRPENHVLVRFPRARPRGNGRHGQYGDALVRPRGKEGLADRRGRADDLVLVREVRDASVGNPAGRVRLLLDVRPRRQRRLVVGPERQLGNDLVRPGKPPGTQGSPDGLLNSRRMNARIFVRRGRKARFRHGHRRENRVVLVRPLRRDPFGNLGREGGHARVRFARAGNVDHAPLGPDGLADVRRGLKDGGDIGAYGRRGRESGKRDAASPRLVLVRRDFPLVSLVRQWGFREPLVRRLRKARVAFDNEG